MSGAASARGETLPPTADIGPPPVVTRHVLPLEHGALAYTVEAGRLPIRDVETGEPHGYIFYVAYRAKGAPARRPVSFVWNGGPGSEATTLEFHVAGPKRVVEGRLQDNAQSWLAASDLVFVDPVGTGFSRPAKAKYSDEFYGTVGDVASVTEFVRSWIRLHHTESAPLYLIGESWGAGRAGSVGYQLQKRGIEIAGLVLISGGAGLSSVHLPPGLGEALRLPDLSATSAYHHKLTEEAGKSSEAVRGEAEAWARSVYAPSLADAAGLSPEDRQRVVDGLVRYSGLSASRIDAASLRITPRGYRTGLLHDEGKTLDTFDMRLTAAPDRPEDAKAILHFLRDDLGYLTDAPYVGLEPLELGYAPDGRYPKGVGARWNYATAPMSKEAIEAATRQAQLIGGGPPRLGPPLPSVEELIALNPKVKVLVAAGQYDSLNSCTANAELARRLTPTLMRAMQFRCYPGGHMMYTDEAARLRLSADVRAFVVNKN